MSAAKSLTLKLLEGHPNQAALRPNMQATGEPVKPDLGPHGSALWDEIVPQLREQGIATSIDAGALESLCFWWDVFKSSQDKLAAVEDITGTDASRAMNFISKAFDNYRRLAQQFGLTAQARNSVSSAPVGDDAGDFFS
ncbi:P27 family phage terminase small subunit [Anatilimnocola floriformis]|uniref:P27 family phage terminase small subunit n=1 Tax=Anatilimnocola floriformis TaxID=2948575 RepID=UPI0020C2A8B2|nr:P27 family phage terminase small subunit [Anatilimnocola floriformis]